MTIRDARAARGWSQRQAATRAGISYSTWNRIEKGKVPEPHTATLRAMANALRVSVSRLIAQAEK